MQNGPPFGAGLFVSVYYCDSMAPYMSETCGWILESFVAKRYPKATNFGVRAFRAGMHSRLSLHSFPLFFVGQFS